MENKFKENLNSELIIQIYKNGIFPMAKNRFDDKIYFVNPKKRAILPIKDFHVSKSFSRFIKRKPFYITINTNFKKVINKCATENRSDTWINKTIEKQFNNLHKIDYNTFSEEIMVKVYDPENIPIHKKLGWDDKYSTVDYDSAGLYTFNNSFNLQNFPFDKQTLKFHIVNNAYMMFEIAAVSDASQLNLQNFIENKSITII